MAIVNKYLPFLLILLTAFSKNDVQREFIAIDWYQSSEKENKLGYTFNDAVFSWQDKQQIPLFVKNYFLDNPGQDYQFYIENPEFEEIDSESREILIPELPTVIDLKKIRLTSGDIHKIEIQVPAVIQQNGRILLLKKFELQKIPLKLKSATTANYTWKEQSVLNTGKWIKIRTPEKGIYKIPYSKLTSWGFNNPGQVRVFGAGGMNLSEDPGKIEYDDVPQLSVWYGKSNGTDCLFFYAPGAITWKPDLTGNYFEHLQNQYSADGFFFLSEQAGFQKNIEMLSGAAEPATHSITSFDEYLLEEKELYNLIQSGRQWFGDKFTHTLTRSFPFLLTDAETGSNFSVRVRAASRASSTSQMTISAGQNNIGSLDFNRVDKSDNTGLYASEKTSRFSIPVSAASTEINLRYAGGGESPEAWLDFIEINYRRRLKSGASPLFFRDLKSRGSANIIEFTIETNTSNLKVWDVSDLFNVKEVPLEFSSNTAKGKQPAANLREYAAFDPNGNIPEPEMISEIENQNLHGISTPEFLIVTNPVFLSHANRLADFHRTRDAMEVEVVPTDKIYNEFSSGSRDATGIRNFIKMLYDRNEGLKYVLLFGDGSYDNKNLKTGTTNLIPTYQSDNSLLPTQSFVTDDYFVILDAGENVFTGAIDLGIGRIPSANTFEAEVVLKKIENYHTPEALGNWRNILCFIADDEDGNRHMIDSEKLANQLNQNHGEFVTDKIFFDAFRQVTGPGGENYPDVTQAINNRVKDGVLVLNYVGHANDRFMSDEKVLDISHINSWSNTSRLPVFVTATCEFSRFDAEHTSAGEYIFFNPNGGGIGLFSTTRLVYANSNYQLSQSFYNYIFAKNQEGNQYRMGDIMRLAKINTTNANVINKRNFSLLADPALKLSYPQHKVITSSVNGLQATALPDTIGALEKVTITGFIADEFQNKLSNFSGRIIPTVYDKAVMKKTRGNAGTTPMEFKVQENIIYQGQAEVINGEFTFSFIVPKDISYFPGRGKIVYYADNGDQDAHGIFENFIIGASGSDIVDTEGPQIKLFLDSPDFVSGDKVSKNPVLLAFLSDENGINMVGTGIGHDITAVINDDFSNPMILNNYYQSGTGDYKSGTITFPLQNLPVGKHSLKLKAWDVANNSSEATIEFEVTGEFTVSNVLNYPNPVNNYTYFTFEHNQMDASFEAIFEIFDNKGTRVDYFTTRLGSNGKVSNPVRWDLNQAMIPLNAGIYPYRITVQNSDGTITSGTGKMIVAH